MRRRMLLLTLLGAAVFFGAPGAAQGDGFIVIDRPMPMPPIRPPHPPRPPRPPALIPLAVKNHQVSCEITDGVAVTRIDQTFYNPNPHQVEGTYIFPLDDDIAVAKFSMFVNGNETQGEILERDKARQIYESIVARMRDPALLEYIGTRMYRARIFPIPASGDVRVKLEYSQVLQIEGGLVRYRYPLNTEKFSSRPLEQVSVVVDIDSKAPIKSVFCPTHTMSVHRESDHQASASFEARNVKPDQDLVLYYTLSDEEFGLALLTYREGVEDGYFLARIAPKVALTAGDVLAKDICFVLDTSGSMAGDKIAQATRALKYCLSSLNRQDRFQLVVFSHESQVFPGGLQEASPQTIEQAKRFVDELRAEGGTNIDGALLDALKPRAYGTNGDRPYLIVFLTDGQPTIGVTEPEKILANVKGANVHAVRLFVFGIGDDVNTHLLDRLAEENRGARDYIGDREDLEIKLSNFYRKVASPVLANLALSWHGVSVHDVFPGQVPDLFAGGEVVLVGRYGGSGPGAVEVQGDRRGTRERHVYESKFTDADVQHSFLPRLWAMRKVGFLLDQIRLHGENKELVDAVVQLAIRHGIVTPYTAYLVHEEQKVALQRGAPQHVLDRVLQSAAAKPAPSGRGRLALGEKFGVGRGGAAGPLPVQDSKEAADLGKLRSLGYVAGISVEDELGDVDAEGAPASPIRQVENRTFYHENGVWIDGTYRQGQETKKVKAFSEEYFALARGDRQTARYLAQGPRVIFVQQGTAYEVVPDPAATD
ncbi:MAG TPA: VIT domain-containing protein [Phycisphaerae bacterium]|nr:VIT domain-containing protein [Phycisphaerae bacterium]